MQVKDLHTDITRYLENDCYCQYEVYDASGFFYTLVRPENECVLIGKNKDVIVAAVQTEYGGDKLIHFYLENDIVVDAMHTPMCQQNIDCAKRYFETLEPQPFVHDTKSVDKILSIADFVICD